MPSAASASSVAMSTAVSGSHMPSGSRPKRCRKSAMPHRDQRAGGRASSASGRIAWTYGCAIAEPWPPEALRRSRRSASRIAASTSGACSASHACSVGPTSKLMRRVVVDVVGSIRPVASSDARGRVRPVALVGDALVPVVVTGAPTARARRRRATGSRAAAGSSAGGSTPVGPCVSLGASRRRKSTIAERGQRELDERVGRPWQPGSAASTPRRHRVAAAAELRRRRCSRHRPNAPAAARRSGSRSRGTGVRLGTTITGSSGRRRPCAACSARCSSGRGSRSTRSRRHRVALVQGRHACGTAG